MNPTIPTKSSREEWLHFIAAEEKNLGQTNSFPVRGAKKLQGNDDADHETRKDLFADPALKKIELLNQVTRILDKDPSQFAISTRFRAVRKNVGNNESFSGIRKYDGIILERGQETFWARLYENPTDYPSVDAEFDLADLPQSDREIAIQGARIVWTIGFEMQRGTLKKQSILYIRRLPPISVKEAEDSKRAVDDLMDEIAWEE